MAPKVASKKASKKVVPEEDVLVEDKPLVVDEPVVEKPQPVEPESGSDTENVKKQRSVNVVPTELMDRVRKQLETNTPELAKKLSKNELKIIGEMLINNLVQMVMNDGKNVSFTHNMTFKRTLRDDRTCKNMQTKDTFVKAAHYVFTMDVMPKLKKEFENVQVDEDDLVKMKAKKEKRSGSKASTSDSE